MRTLYLAVTLALGFTGVSEAPMVYSVVAVPLQTPLPKAAQAGLVENTLRFSAATPSTSTFQKFSPPAAEMDNGGNSIIVFNALASAADVMASTQGTGASDPESGGAIDPILAFAAPGTGLQAFFAEPETAGQATPGTEGLNFPPFLPGTAPIGAGAPAGSGDPHQEIPIVDDDKEAPFDNGGNPPGVPGGHVVPEPASVILFGAGAFGIALWRRGARVKA